MYWGSDEGMGNRCAGGSQVMELAGKRVTAGRVAMTASETT